MKTLLKVNNTSGSSIEMAIRRISRLLLANGEVGI